MLTAALLALAAAPVAYDPLFHDAFEQTTSCPAGLQKFSDIGYVGDNISGDVRYNVDVTEWKNIWGHATASDATVDWPGRPNSSPVIMNFGKVTYIAAHFRVPQGTPPSWFGWITHTEYVYGHNLTGAISRYCGDFSPNAQACFINSKSGQNLVPWRTRVGNFCPLEPNTDYYLNLKMTNPNEASATCARTSSSCAIGTANAFGP